MSIKQKALVIAPHDEYLDPRVSNVCNTLSRKYNVDLLTLSIEKKHNMQRECRDSNYKTKKIEYRHNGFIVELYAFTKYYISKNRLFDVFLYLVIYLPAFGLLLIFSSFLYLFWFLSSFFYEKTQSSTQNKLKLIYYNNIINNSFCNAVLNLKELASIIRYTMQANYHLKKHMRKDDGSYELVYCNDLYCLQAGVDFKNKYNAMLIYDSHEFYPFIVEHKLYKLIVGFYEKQLLKDIDKYITVSEPLANALSKYYCHHEIHVIPNVEPLRPININVTNTLTDKAKGRIKVLFQGSFASGRGIEEVLDEWVSVDASRAALFIRGPDNIWKEKLRRQAMNLELLDKSVFFLPAVLEDELITFASEADIGLIPYTSESSAYKYACPNKLFQYLYAGLVILSNNTSYIECLCKHEQIGRIYDSNVKGSFVSELNRLLDYSYLNKLKNNVKPFVLNKYNWNVYEDKLLKIAES